MFTLLAATTMVTTRCLSAGQARRSLELSVLLAIAGFLLPAGYQTHLMVFGPGGYRVRDFVRIGLPMVALWFVVTMLVVPWVWL